MYLPLVLARLALPSRRETLKTLKTKSSQSHWRCDGVSAVGQGLCLGGVLKQAEVPWGWP